MTLYEFAECGVLGKAGSAVLNMLSAFSVTVEECPHFSSRFITVLGNVFL